MGTLQFHSYFLFSVKIYDVSSGKSIPEYMEEAKKKKIKLKHLEEYRNRIELIQDFEFNISSQRVKVSEGNIEEQTNFL